MWRNCWSGVAPSTVAASSRVPGIASSRAVRKRKAKGKDRQASKRMTVSSAIEIGSSSPKSEMFLGSLRKAIGFSHRLSSRPQKLTIPNCGLSIVFQTKVAATTGAT